MTYSEAVTLKSAVEAGLSAAAAGGTVSVSHGDRAIVYYSYKEAVTLIANLSRSIQTYNRKSKNQNPDWRSPTWR